MTKTETIMPRGEQSVPAKGHNADNLLKEYVEKVAKKTIAIEGMNGDIKEILRGAKNDGFSKMAIRRAVKNLRMTPEQKQARDEVDDLTLHYTNLCSDLPLFKQASAQAA